MKREISKNVIKYQGINFYAVGNMTYAKNDCINCIGKSKAILLNKDLGNWDYNEFYETAKKVKGWTYVDLYTTDKGGLFIPTNYGMFDISEAIKPYGWYDYKPYTEN